MPAIRETEQFSSWLSDLRDVRAKAKVLVRVERLAKGNAGDVKPVGEGISELRIHYGAGYRVYFTQRGEELILLLCGGDKDSQDKDIANAKKIASELEE
ncbi:type II toxin-antitoxin system RelE/ParE family toxin [Bradyrhizobium japonicum]|uniref:type II toxin-antitoxin system RelE/ParE family toxin n=1 Tax=Bradyrhizobium japonicum TaxID=375 RepID=UPI00200C97B7|nr:type II toxin-antitoxin system RelE/ParE family toxin [Bradyrhizobium japonicum]UQE03674.1 type II toxin-antitoxin system RelE/ParE family toxin [Bradyrhizobium japonicum]